MSMASERVSVLRAGHMQFLIVLYPLWGAPNSISFVDQQFKKLKSKCWFRVTQKQFYEHNLKFLNKITSDIFKKIYSNLSRCSRILNFLLHLKIALEEMVTAMEDMSTLQDVEVVDTTPRFPCKNFTKKNNTANRKKWLEFF